MMIIKIMIIKNTKIAGTMIIHSSILSPSSLSCPDIPCSGVSIMSTSIVDHMIYFTLHYNFSFLININKTNDYTHVLIFFIPDSYHTLDMDKLILLHLPLGTVSIEISF